MFVPIERKKVSSQVLDQLKKMIKEKTFPPESRLPWNMSYPKCLE